jgi:hypothetical protein
MVNYVTRITVKLSDGQQALFEHTDTGYVKRIPLKEEQLESTNTSRNIALLQVLERNGFAFKISPNYIYAVSTEIEAQEAKELLLAQGFHDNEFQIFLEYTRKWGTL